MCPPRKSCDNYEPNMDKDKWSGNLCTGFGWTPPCKYCGLGKRAHRSGALWS